jgi:hypothetical protein
LEDVGRRRGELEGQLESVVETVADSEERTNGHVLRQVEDSGRRWVLVGWKRICLTENRLVVRVLEIGRGDVAMYR